MPENIENQSPSPFIPPSTEPNPGPSLRRSRVLWPFAGLVVVLLLLVGAYSVANLYKTTPRTNHVAASVPVVVVTIQDSGFDPKEVLITKGSIVKWVNETKSVHTIGANPYPTHKELPNLLSSDIAPQMSYTYKFTGSGQYGYADYTHPTTTGTVTVK